MNKYEKVAGNEAKKYHDYPDLIGILWIGSTVFGIQDELADIDIRLLTKNPKKSQPMKQYKVDSIKIEIDEMSIDWLLNDLSTDSEQAWIVEKSIILFDPKNDLSKKINQAKAKLSKTDNKKLLWDSYSQLYSHYDLEKCLKRNQIITAHIVLSNILDALSKFIFLSKDMVVPSQKWRWYIIKTEKLFKMTQVNQLVKLNLQSFDQDIISMIKEIQKEVKQEYDIM